jgi:hypothetical protein
MVTTQGIAQIRDEGRVRASPALFEEEIHSRERVLRRHGRKVITLMYDRQWIANRGLLVDEERIAIRCQGSTEAARLSNFDRAWVKVRPREAIDLIRHRASIRLRGYSA